MFASISFRIANWKLALLALIGFALLMNLGFWQLSRAKEKKILLNSFAERTLQTPFLASDLTTPQDLRYYRTQLIGEFDNQHSYLLDNKIQDGVVGYEVYTPFVAHGLAKPILIDRGFIPMGQSRREIPAVRDINGKVRLLGMLNTSPSYVALGAMNADQTSSWPKRVEYIDLKKLFGNDIYPYILMLHPGDPAAYKMQWSAITTMPPERHIGYAVQWFALATTLLILFVVLNCRRVNA